MLEEDLEAAYENISWETGPYMHDCMTIIDLLQSEGREEEIKKAGQDGECIHDYSGTEMTRRGGRTIKHYVTTYNEDYETVFFTCEPSLQRRVMHWINTDRGITDDRKV